MAASSTAALWMFLEMSSFAFVIFETLYRIFDNTKVVNKKVGTIIFRSAYHLCLNSYANLIYRVFLITRDCRASGTTSVCAPKMSSALRRGVQRLKKKTSQSFWILLSYTVSVLSILHTFIPSTHAITSVLPSTVTAGLCCCIYVSHVLFQ
jgi:hypothetical protein